MPATLSQRLFVPLLAVATAMLLFAPILVAWAPYESTMGLIQKVFYVHVPSAMVMFVSAFVCGIASAIYLFKGTPRADRRALAAAELVVVFGAIVLVTGPLWARKAWGVYWQWDARLTMTLVVWLTFVAYLLLRRYGGAGSEKLAAAVGLFGMANIPFVYWSVNVWRTIHPRTTVVWSLDPSMRPAFWWSVCAFLLFYVLLLSARLRLEDERARLDGVFLTFDEEE